MDIAKGKRVSAKEAADILGVPRYSISRLDRAGEIIKRYKLGHKTHVYDLDSLYEFLASCQSKPLQKPVVSATAGRSNASSRVSASKNEAPPCWNYCKGGRRTSAQVGKRALRSRHWRQEAGRDDRRLRDGPRD